MPPPVNYPAHRSRIHEADGRPLPARPATPADHHDHRHFPHLLGDCRICDQIEESQAIEILQNEKKSKR